MKSWGDYISEAGSFRLPSGIPAPPVPHGSAFSNQIPSPPMPNLSQSHQMTPAEQILATALEPLMNSISQAFSKAGGREKQRAMTLANKFKENIMQELQNSQMNIRQ